MSTSRSRGSRGGRSALGYAGGHMVGSQSSGMLVSKSELNRMRKLAIIKTTDDLQREKREHDDKLAVKRQFSNQRKEKMARLAADAKRNAPKSDVVLLKEAEAKALLDNADEMRDQDLDAVKLLNTLGARAAAFTIRQQQLIEMEGRRDAAKVYDQKMNLEMELARLQDIQRQKAIEDRKARQRKIDQGVLMEQIANRAKDRKNKMKLIEDEKLEQIEKMRRQREDDKIAAKQEAIRKAAIMEEVKRSNEHQKLMNIQRTRRDDEENQRIEKYQVDKAAKEARDEAIAVEKAHQKELLQAKMLKHQEQQGNAKSDLDELRAKRAFEGREREFRRAEQGKMAKEKADLISMNIDRNNMIKYKKIQKIMMIKEQQMEYERICMQNDNDLKSGITKDEQAHQRRLQNKASILKQIDDKQRRFAADRQQVQKEGKIIKDGFSTELNKLEKIRKEYVQKLESRGVKTEYLAELKRTDMSKIQMV